MRLIIFASPASLYVPDEPPYPCAGVLAPEGFRPAGDPAVAPGPEIGTRPWRDGRRLAPGELDTGVNQWAHRQKELLSRRLYLKDFWYAAGEWGTICLLASQE